MSTMSQILIGVLIAIISATLSYFLSRLHFYTSIYHRKAINFLEDYHFNLLYSLQNVLYHAPRAFKTPLDPKLQTVHKFFEHKLELALDDLEDSIKKYISKGGYMILKELDNEAAENLISLQFSSDIFNNIEKLKKVRDVIAAMDLDVLFDKLNKISYKDLVNVYKLLLTRRHLISAPLHKKPDKENTQK